MLLVTVIVPVYNLEKYLPRCLDMILNQTLKDIEVILVDDGSTDSSYDICRQYETIYPNVKVICKSNGGASSARNVGIDNASGQYLSFVDADDIIAPDFLETLYNMAVANASEIACCKNARVQEDEEVAFKADNSPVVVLSGVEALGYALLGTKVSGSLCDKLIRRDVLSTLRFKEGILYEDAELASRMFPICEHVAVTSEVKYFYTYRPNSATTKKFDDSAIDAIRVYEKIADLVTDKYPEIVNEAQFRLLWAHYEVFDRILNLDNYKEISEFQFQLHYLRNHFVETIKSPYFRVARKIGAIALRVDVRLYKKLIGLR